jgi:hypothetical protein
MNFFAYNNVAERYAKSRPYVHPFHGFIWYLQKIS